jgi:triphosphoribosyl-dephospho-CoA synthase
MPPLRSGLRAGLLAQLACILEATARKPGNVHPARSFDDTSYSDFVLSAAAVAPALDEARARSVGETVLAAVRATREVTGKNTNLGIGLLLAPLCALPLDAVASAATAAGIAQLERALRESLRALTRRDAELVYEAIRLASPGGLGSAKEGDVRDAPSGTLLEMMELARERDLIARQYSNAYREVIHDGLAAIVRGLGAGTSLEDAIILCHLELLARHGDSLILRKCGEAASTEAARRSRAVLDRGWPNDAGARAELDSLDRWLREDGNRRNPGACADLTAAALFLALASEIISLPIRLGNWAHG